MKIYSCDICGELIYFENSQCVNCGSNLGYLPILDNMSSLEPINGMVFEALAPQAQGATYKKCHNYEQENVCNWMIPTEDPNAFCLSCRLNEIIPDLSVSGNRELWHRLEVAKRRLIYSLIRLQLPLQSKVENSVNGLAFAFLGDEKDPTLHEDKKLLIGHEEGKITINIAEANDAIREKMRLDMNERYRTVLGHFRHEIGHYYWFLIVEKDFQLLSEFRNLFGDERADYGEALKNYYANGAESNWQSRCISAYASAHPWEDWAESWAHYLHMFDTLETAQAWGLSIANTQINKQNVFTVDHHIQTFDEMRNQWTWLSSALNSLNRSMGMKDVYPFFWSEAVIEKLRFIQQVIINSKEC